MKRIVAISLISLLVFQSFEKFSILVYYQTYKDYIAKYLCENREVAGSNCKGQCYLMKKLQNTEERNSTPVVPDNQKSEFIYELLIHENFLSFDIIPKLWPAESVCHEKEHLFDIFHPPQS